MLVEEKMPEAWRNSCVVSLFKCREDLQNYGNLTIQFCNFFKFSTRLYKRNDYKNSKISEIVKTWDDKKSEAITFYKVLTGSSEIKRSPSLM